MDETSLRGLLEAVAAGSVAPSDALQRLKHFSLEDLGSIQLDHHRELRRGFPEVIYGPGKTLDDLERIIAAQLAHGSQVIVTRVKEDTATVLQARCVGLHYNREAQVLHSAVVPELMLPVTVLVIAAGTADLPVAREAACIAALSGCAVETIADAGIAGVHRLTTHIAALDRADILIVVAGMEGALPSLVGGLTDKPLIAIPTSAGYGSGLGGFAAMLTMLNSCAAGSVVVNIDNGFGAGFFAGLLGRQIARRLRHAGVADAVS